MSQGRSTKFFRRIFGPSGHSSSAGTGIIGLLGFLVLLIISGLFFITENYFVSMMLISLALLVYLTGTGIAQVMVSSFTIFFSGKHLMAKAVCIKETLKGLDGKLVSLDGDSVEKKKKSVKGESITIRLPNNQLAKDIQKLIQEGKEYEAARYVAHQYYTDCLELYDHTHGHLEFVADAMPLFGLIGTILGLISMFDGLGANVTVESLSPQLALALKTTLYGAIFSSIYKIIGSRFEQRLKALEYDFEAFCIALEVLMAGDVTVELES